MYLITVVNSTGEYTLFNTYDDELKISNPVLTLELNKSGTLTFNIESTHPSRDQILPLASEIYVYRDGNTYWIGRPLMVEDHFNLTSTVTCEGVLGYLLDTQVPPFDFTEGNSIKGRDCLKTFLQRLVSRHNSSLSSSWEDQRKKFSVGNVTVYDSNNNLARSSEGYATTLETINTKMLETHGGFLRVRYSGTTRYIDYIDTFGNATQPISFGENLLDLTAHVNTEEIATNIIPLGAQKEDTDQRITLAGYTPTATVRDRISTYTHGGAIRSLGSSSSFSGFTSIYDKRGEDNHGRVYVVQIWDDVTLQENLALKAAEYIGTISVLGKTIDLSAVDLAQIDIDYHSFNLGEMATVVSIPHSINAPYQITQMSIDLYNPANSKLTLGGELRTFTFGNTKKQAEIVTELSSGISEAVQNATSLLSGGKGGYLIIRQDETGQPYEILIMNQAKEEDATNCIRINRNGLGFGTKAYGQSASSWVYNNAWTIDGWLSADFIRTGVLRSKNMVMAIDLEYGSVQLDDVYLSKNGLSFYENGKIKSAFNPDGFGVYKDINKGEYLFNVWANGDMLCRPDWGDVAFNVDGESISMTVGKTDLTVFHESIDIEGQVNFYGNLLCDVGTSLFEINSGYVNLWNSQSEAKVLLNNYGLTLVTGRSTTAHSGNLYITTTGTAYYANEGSSSRKIKHDIKSIENKELDPNRLYDVKVIQYKYNDDFVSDDDPNKGKDLVGFIVEELDDVYPAAVQKEDEKESKTWTWSPYRIIPPMLQLIQEQNKKIDSLEQRIEKLESLVLKGEDNG